MKKTFLAALLACLLLLSGCRNTPARESETPTPTPTPTQDQTAETPPVSPDPETSADPGYEAPEFPQFLRDFTFSLADTLVPDAQELQFVTHCLTPEEQGKLQTVLDMASWREATDIPAMGLEGATTFYDKEGHSLVIDNWGEETCLILAKSGNDSYLYFAPYSVLENTRAFVDRLTPLGIIDPTAAWYFDLFWNDPGFDALVSLCGDNGAISDDQLAAYALTVLGYEGAIDYEVGVPAEDINAITRKHFGRPMDSFDNSMSKTLPSGNITATGWDVNFSAAMVLIGEPETDEYGNITATFYQYLLGDDLWLDGDMDPIRLNHLREYLLTGNDDGGFPRPTRVSVTFRIESETVNGVWREYLIYDAIRDLGI